MSREVVISLLFCTASLQPVTAGGWRSPGGSDSPCAGLRVGFPLGWCAGSIWPGLGGRLGWALGGRITEPEREVLGRVLPVG